MARGRVSSRARCLRWAEARRDTLFRCHVRLHLTLPSNPPRNNNPYSQASPMIHHFFAQLLMPGGPQPLTVSSFKLRRCRHSQTSSSLAVSTLPCLSAALEPGGTIALIHPPLLAALCSTSAPSLLSTSQTSCEDRVQSFNFPRLLYITLPYSP